MNKKLKNVLNIALDILMVLFLVFAAITLVISLSQKAQEPGGEPSHLFGTSIRSVQSDSMEPYNEDGSKYESKNAFYEGDIIFCKLTKEGDTFQKGDAVMFWMPLDADGHQCSNQLYHQKKLVTHEIVEIETKEDGTVLYYTQGLNHKLGKNVDKDLLPKTADEIVAKYNGKRIGGVGKVIDFVQSGIGFFLCIILPILIFVVIQVIRVIRNVIAYKAQKAQLAAASGELTEEQKRQIAEEYLKQQASESNATPSTDQKPADEESSVEEDVPADDVTSSNEEITADDE